MPAARLRCPLTRLARVWLNLCLEGCSLDVRGRHRRHGRWLPSRARCPHQSRPRRLDLCGHRSPRSLGMRGLLLRCLGRLLSGRARHLTVPRTSPCTSCGCGRLICHAHIHSWCTKVLDFAALVQNSERTVPRWRFPRVDLHKTVKVNAACESTRNSCRLRKLSIVPRRQHMVAARHFISAQGVVEIGWGSASGSAETQYALCRFYFTSSSVMRV